ncbi:MAG: flavodoxin [Panacagrimonas sp.]|nr:PepSY-associated TM helix domain-containing protein [Panacagrimonas sp.]MCC2656360.1 flavodoxin [Panacagrimonas sp.]
MRNLWFQLHWLLGITAGLVLAVMGITGAALSFENELLRALNPAATTVAAQRDPMLTPPQLLERLTRTQPERAIGSISMSNVPGRAARVGFLPPGKAKARAPGNGGARPRMDMHFADPYTGTLIGREDDLLGHDSLHLMEDLHRRLAADDKGKAVTGASTVVLLYLAASGLYLRWPRRWRDLRAWLAVRWRMRSAPFLKNLHEVVGTWLLLPYVLVALTGLWWSYEWYRNGVLSLTGSKPPARAPARDAGVAPAPVAQIDAAWTAFTRQVAASGGWSSVSFNVPAADQPLVLSYVDADPAHERANNRLVVDLSSATVREHERYDDKSAGQKLAASMFVLHKGSFFGVAGTVAMMLASLSMPLFAVTGWMLYLKRRRRGSLVARPMAAEDEAGEPAA